MRVLFLDAEQANAVRGLSSPGAALDPLPVEVGAHAGKWALPEAVLTDPDHASKRDALLAALPVVEADPAELWAADPAAA